MCLTDGYRGYISREVCASLTAIEATSPERYVPHWRLQRLHLQRGMCLTDGYRGYISREVCASSMALNPGHCHSLLDWCLLFSTTDSLETRTGNCMLILRMTSWKGEKMSLGRMVQQRSIINFYQKFSSFTTEGKRQKSMTGWEVAEKCFRR